MSDSGDDKPLSKEDVAGGAQAPGPPARPTRRRRFVDSTLGWAWTIFWLAIFFSVVGSAGAQIVAHLAPWVWHIWDQIIP